MSPSFRDEIMFLCVLALFWSPFHYLVFNPDREKSGEAHIIWTASARAKPFFLHPTAAMQPSNDICGVFMRERTQKRAGKKLNSTVRRLVSVGDKLSSVCLYPNNREWTGLHPLRYKAWSASSEEIQHTDTHTCIHMSTFPMHVCAAMSPKETGGHIVIPVISAFPLFFGLLKLMSLLATSSRLCVHLLLSFLLFMHVVLCQLKNIISIQTGRDSAGAPQACKFIWFVHRRQRINLLRRETGVLMALPRADIIACLRVC